MAAGLLTWLFFSKMELEQIGAAAVIGLASTVFVNVLARYARLSFHIQWDWLGAFLRRTPGQLFRGIIVLAAVLGRSIVSGVRPTGSFHTDHDTPGKRDVAAGRRALVLAAVSLAPASFAVSFQNGSSLLFHQLSLSAGLPLKDWKL